MKLLVKGKSKAKRQGKVARGASRQAAAPPPFPNHAVGSDRKIRPRTPSLPSQPSGLSVRSASRSVRSGRSRSKSVRSGRSGRSKSRSAASRPRQTDYSCTVERRDDRPARRAASVRYHNEPARRVSSGDRDHSITSDSTSNEAAGTCVDDLSETLFEVSTACLIREHELEDVVDVVKTADVVPIRSLRKDTPTRGRGGEAATDPYLEARTLGTFRRSTSNRSMGESFSMRSASSKRARRRSSSRMGDRHSTGEGLYQYPPTRETREPEGPSLAQFANAVLDDIVWKASGCFIDPYEGIEPKVAQKTVNPADDVYSLDTYSTPEHRE
ncbi:hypothetical protein ACHAXT_007974 [Thalassiosira profunda]